MKRFAILTAIGHDRVGIVDDLSTSILDFACNIEESRMALLGGEFVSILLISGTADDVQKLIDKLREVGTRLGLTLQLSNTEMPAVDSESRPYLLESVSLDTPGIVHAVTSVLRRHSVNIQDLETETTAAPWTGAPMFVMKARVVVPRSVSVKRLRAELDDLSMQNDLDIRLTAL